MRMRANSFRNRAYSHELIETVEEIHDSGVRQRFLARTNSSPGCRSPIYLKFGLNAAAAIGSYPAPHPDPSYLSPNVWTDR